MNIFLVEDERWALAELIELFKVYEPEHRIYGFECGEDALAFAREIKPQVIMTDINMPGIDGLDVIRELNRLDSSIKGIILSVHDQFDYAQKGVKIGVIDYLLKPARKDALYRSVDNAIHLVELNSKKREERSNWLIAQMLLSPNVEDNEISECIRTHNYVLILLLLGNGGDILNWGETTVTKSEIKKHFIRGSIAENDIYCIDINNQRRVLLVPAANKMEIKLINDSLFSLYQRLTTDRMIVQISYVFKPEQEGLFKYNTYLNEYIENNMKLGLSSYLPPGKQVYEIDLSAMWEKVRILEMMIMRGEWQKGKEAIHSIFLNLEQRNITVRQLTQFVRDMLYSLKYNLHDGIMWEDQSSKPMQDQFKMIRASNYRELSEWLYKKIWELFGENELKNLKPKGLVPIMTHWIHNHYHQEITLSQFAADNHVSVGYLSRLFKAQTGQTFSDFLIGCRVEKAKELLQMGVDRLIDVSRLVGYEDAKHFSQLFKRVTGQSPMEYMKRIKGVNKK